MSDPECDWCEEKLQPYLDRELTEAEQAKVKAHLADCKWCDDRYKFEGDLRRLVRLTVVEPMDPALKLKLSELRLEL
ncbi:MAG TPA: zf-HC2 domain-containing protein [Gaiellaceae bacterium]|nr:zf-HC2 domain-containing protein [Gaiellaceae bacterium]